MKKLIVATLLAGSMLAGSMLAAQPASAASIINGSFEAGAVNPGSFTTIGSGNSTTITGWTVGGHSVDYVGGYWQAADGTRSIDLAGNGIGSIAQALETAIGQAYRVIFSVSRNSDGGSNPRTGFVDVGGPQTAISFNNASTSHEDMGWEVRSFDFVASSLLTTLRFSADPATSSGLFGLALDNVSIGAIPEASTWAMMIAGLGVVGFAMRRRQSNLKVAFS